MDQKKILIIVSVVALAVAGVSLNYALNARQDVAKFSSGGDTGSDNSNLATNNTANLGNPVNNTNIGSDISDEQKIGSPVDTAVKENTAATAKQATIPGSVSAQPVATASTGIFVNNKELTQAQVEDFTRRFGSAPAKGKFWYDAKSGAYGVMGQATVGFLAPGLSFASMPRNASGGSSGVTINGRELPDVEIAFFYQLFGTVIPGDYWFDGNTGYMGVVGSNEPFVNLLAAVQQALSSSGSSLRKSFYGDSSVGGGGGCIYANFRDAGSGSYSGAMSGCD